jgi:hypothetical protein
MAMLGLTACISPPEVDVGLRTVPYSDGIFHASQKDLIIALEVTDKSWIQGTEAIAELYVPVRTFLAYITVHPSTPTAADSSLPACLRYRIVP